MRRLPFAAVLLCACAGAPPAPEAPATSAAPATPATSAAPALAELPPEALCAHGVPKEACTACDPSRLEGFKARGDFCAEHGLPESHCKLCHPDLRFYALPEPPPGADLLHLSTMGEDVPSLEAHVAPGKVTVFDFWAHWCVPCRQVDAHLLGVLGARADVAYRKLNVVSWETPVAKRYLAEVPALPYAIVYGKDGKLVRAVSGLDLAALDAAIAEGAAR